MPASDVYAWAKAETKPSYSHTEVGAAASSHTHSYLLKSSDTLTGLLQISGQKSLDTTTPGLTNYGLHFTGQTTADYATGITWNGGTGSVGAQAGIYVQGSGAYGTKMFFATTNSYAIGAQTAISIDQTGVVNFVRSRPTVLGNLILDAGNYNNYSPSKTGGGASGSWGISITGNAATATKAATLTTARTLTIGSTGKTFNGSANVSWTLAEIGAAASSHSHTLLNSWPDTRSTGTVPNDYNRAFAVSGMKSSSAVGTPMSGTYVSILGFRGWSDSSGGIATELAFGDEGIAFRQGATTAWGSWLRLIHSGNYNSYAPTKTGTGASGTWGISITGSSASCTGNAATASDSSKLGGLSLGNATQGSHPGANAVVRTDGNGYLNVGWINTVSGTATGTPTRIYCSQDAYLRYYAPDNATLRRSMKAYITYGTAAASGGSSGDIYIKY